MSIIKPASFINQCDLIRSNSSFADEKAKQMMGAANPLIGSDIRKPASTFCSGCGRWHRPGNMCPATNKSQITEGKKALPGSLHQDSFLSYQSEPPTQESTEDQQQNFVDSSAYMQNQQENYLNALRVWQAKFGA